MPALAISLAGLRRSVLGAWLAMAYALAVLASALLPMPAMAMSAGLDGAVLCSGVAAPGDDLPASGGEREHCKGCPANPVIAAPPAGAAPVPFRFAATPALAPMPKAAVLVGVNFGLPRPRAPPFA